MRKVKTQLFGGCNWKWELTKEKGTGKEILRQKYGQNEKNEIKRSIE